MNLFDIYKKFGVPPNLQDHMLRVYGVVNFLEEHWVGEEKIDWNLVKTITLLHDLGNLVKFNLDKHPEFLGDEQNNLEFWKKVQKEVREKYGADDHEATQKILREIGLKEEMINVILNKSFGNSIATANSDNWPLKILFYADLRTLPWGIGTLEERMTDAKERMPQYSSRPDFEDLVDACREIEKQLQQNLNISVAEITDESVKLNKEILHQLRV